MSAVLPALCAGLGGGCLFWLPADPTSRVEVKSPVNAEAAEQRRLPWLFRRFPPLTGNLEFLARQAALTSVRDRAAERLQSAGMKQLLNATRFTALRLLLGLLGVLLAVLLGCTGQLLCGFLILVLLLLYPSAWLRKTIRLRHLEILKARPNVLDLLTLSVEAGKDFFTALRDIPARRAPDALGNELQQTLHEIQLGTPRQRARRDLADRVRHPELTAIVRALIRADELGIGIGQLLRIQGGQLRHKRFARAETLANEAPVKILFPAALFIFPSVFIILIAPIAAQALRTIAW